MKQTIMENYSDNEGSYVEANEDMDAIEETRDDLSEGEYEIITNLRKDNEFLKAHIAELNRTVSQLVNELRHAENQLNELTAPKPPTLAEIVKSAPKKNVSTDFKNVQSASAAKPQSAPPIKRARKESSSSEEENDKATEQPKKEKIPPITMKGTSDWVDISKALFINKIDYNRATVVKDGIRIIASSIDDFRKLTKFLDYHRKEYFTYQMEEEKKIYALLRHLPLDADLQLIKNDLISQGISDAEVSRMISNRTKKPIPLYLVKFRIKEFMK